MYAAIRQRRVVMESATWRCALVTRVGRNPRVRQMGRGSQIFFIVILNEALSTKKPSDAW